MNSYNRSNTIPSNLKIPRSSSTSDLFDLGANTHFEMISHANLPKKRRHLFVLPSNLNNKSSMRNDYSINHLKNVPLNIDNFEIPKKYSTQKKLTQYQLQRQKMKRSFMFPNGENFTPKKYNDKSLKPRRKIISANLKHNLSNSLKNGSDVNIRKSISMTSIPNTPSYHRRNYSDSVNYSPQFINKTNNFTLNTVYLQSPVNSKKSTDTENCMKESLNSDIQSDNTLLSEDCDQNDIFKPMTKPLIMLHVPTSGKIVKPDVITPKSSSSETVTKKDSSIESENKRMTNPPKETITSITKSKEIKKRKTNPPEESITSITKPKEIKKRNVASGSKLSSFFKKIWGGSSDSHNTKHKLHAPIHVNSTKSDDGVEVDTVLESISITLDIDKETHEDLMDTDLIFDSLLLKVNNPKLLKSINRPVIVEKSEFTAEVSDDISDELSVEDTNFVDYGLINDFAKLGEFINLSISENENSIPPRSTKRPQLRSKECASSFYNAQPNIVKRLQAQFDTVLFDNVHSALSHVSSNDSNVKTVRFANEVYLTDTYSPFDYERRDHKFREKMVNLMQGSNLIFFENVKRELNEYKRNEMIIHEQMTQYTQFFD